MKKMGFLLLSLGAFLISVTVYSQKGDGSIEAVGSGVIEFLLTNPSTADNTNETQEAALVVLQNFLSRRSEKKHELNVASSSRDEMNININPSYPPQSYQNSLSIASPDGNLAQIVMDYEGKLYILYKGIISPISDNLINQAKEETFSLAANRDNKFIPPYDLEEVENNFRFEKREKGSVRYYTVRNKEGEYLKDIANMYHVPFENVSIWSYHGRDIEVVYDAIKEGKRKLPYESKVKIRKEDEKLSLINFLFTCRWANDFDGDGYNLGDFQDIRNSFSIGDDFMITTGIQNDFPNRTIEFSIYNFKNGERIYFSSNKIEIRDFVFTLTNPDFKKIEEGVYIINAQLMEDNNVISSKRIKIEIINLD